MIEGLLHDPAFFVAVATVVFIALVYKKVSVLIATSLDVRSEKIENELSDALSLREEAQALLASYQRKQIKAVEESEVILANAKIEANKIIENAANELEEEIERRMVVAAQKITQAENNAIKAIQDNAVDVTISAARSLIMNNLSKEAAEIVMESAMSDMTRKLH